MTSLRYNTTAPLPMVAANMSAVFPTDNVSTMAVKNNTVHPYTTAQTILISTAVSTVILGIIVGNFFVCTSTLTQRKLRTVHNWFLVSLAIADLLVGVLIMPLALVNELLGYWYFERALCDLFLSTDIFVCTASILNLCGVAIDRYWAATNPPDLVEHKEKRRAKIAIAVVWFLAFLISVAPLFGWKDARPWDPDYPQCRYSADVGYVLFSASGSFFIPLVAITIAYSKVYSAVTTRLLKKTPFKKPAPTAKDDTTHRPAIIIELATPSAERCDSRNGTGKTKQSTTLETRRKSVSGNSSADFRPTPLRRSYSLDSVLATRGELNSSLPNISMWFPDIALADINLHIQADSTTDGGLTGSLSPQDEEPGNNIEMLSSRQVSESPRKDDSSTKETLHCLRSAKQRPYRRRKKSKSVMAEMVGHLQSKERFLKKKERRLTLILGIVITAFVVCWLPFFVTYVIITVCETCAVSDVIFKLFVWLGYCNSAVNPVIYTVFNKDFVAILAALRKVMCVGAACH
ncbi:Alpha-2B adrenergic receptor [Branchiostoma belcheri]|nr:Alpha-2B adrenergic receptor [Branchiostoma belcheri]